MPESNDAEPGEDPKAQLEPVEAAPKRRSDAGKRRGIYGQRRSTIVSRIEELPLEVLRKLESDEGEPVLVRSYARLFLRAWDLMDVKEKGSSRISRPHFVAGYQALMRAMKPIEQREQAEVQLAADIRRMEAKRELELQGIGEGQQINVVVEASDQSIEELREASGGKERERRLLEMAAKASAGFSIEEIQASAEQSDEPEEPGDGQDGDEDRVEEQEPGASYGPEDVADELRRSLGLDGGD